MTFTILDIIRCSEFYLKMTFRRLDYVSVLKLELLSWIQLSVGFK
jgi:hypothetical protein